jgi:pimeloyl-ACP methyl ester carboxylesterase
MQDLPIKPSAFQNALAQTGFHTVRAGSTLVICPNSGSTASGSTTESTARDAPPWHPRDARFGHALAGRRQGTRAAWQVHHLGPPGFHSSAPAVPFVTLDLVDHVDDAAAVLAALHAGPAVVIGRSTGGLIAIELPRRFPDKVKALVLLEPALFTIDPDSDARARNLRLRVLQRSSGQPRQLAETVVLESLGDRVRESFPAEVRRTLPATGPAVLAEIKGHGMDLSEDALELNEDELAEIRRPALIMSAEDSIEACRLVNAR